MKKIAAILVLITAAAAFGQADLKLFNRGADKDLILKVTEAGGAKKEVARFRSDGSNSIVPPGVVMPYAGSTAPAGYLICDGASYDSDANPELAPLFAAIGTTFGGSGSSSFNVPDLRGRTVAGVDGGANRLTSGGSGINGAVVGAAGGAETHTLSTAQLPSHTHGSGGYSTSLGISQTVASAGHKHGIGHVHQWSYIQPGSFDHIKAIDTSGFATTVIDSSSTTIAGSVTSSLEAGGPDTNRLVAIVGGSARGFYTTGVLSSQGGGTGSNAKSDTPDGTTALSLTGSNNVTGTSGSTGSGNAHQNTQPTMVLNYIIKL